MAPNTPSPNDLSPLEDVESAPGLLTPEDEVVQKVCKALLNRDVVPPAWRDNRQLLSAVRESLKAQRENRHTKEDTNRIIRAFLLFIIEGLVKKDFKDNPDCEVEIRVVNIKARLMGKMRHVWAKLDDSFVEAAIRLRCEKVQRTLPPPAVESEIDDEPESATIALPAPTIMPIQAPMNSVDPELAALIEARRAERLASTPPVPVVSDVSIENLPVPRHISATSAAVWLLLVGTASVGAGVVVSTKLFSPESMSQGGLVDGLIPVEPMAVASAPVVTSAPAFVEPTSVPPPLPSSTKTLTFEIDLGRNFDGPSNPEPGKYYVKLRRGVLPNGQVDMETVVCGVEDSCKIDIPQQCGAVNHATTSELARFRCSLPGKGKVHFVIGKGGIDMSDTEHWQEVP